MKSMKRVLAMLLCVVLVIGLIPASVMSVLAAEDATGAVVDAAIIFSDLHTSSSNYKESTVKGVMTAVKNTGMPISSVISAGDAFSVNADSTKYTGKTSTITGYIQDVLGDVPVSYVWSDHDRYALEADDSTLLNKKSRLVYGAGADGKYGTDDDGNYYIYSLSMGDLCSYDRYKAGFNYTQSSNNRVANGFTATVPEAIANFEADAAKLKKDRPLFIVSHQPLYDNRNDNAWAEDWCDAINEVAETMDVAFFYGHNHKYDKASDYYYAKGSKMPVATADKWNWDYDVGEGYLPSMDLSSKEVTLNFTHMCGGYLAPSSTGSTSSTTREGVVVGITVYENAINYTTYNANGVYTGNYALNETVVREHAAVEEPAPEPTDPEPTEPEATEPETPAPGDAELTDHNVTVKAPGLTSLAANPVNVPASAADLLEEGAVAYDINVAGFVNESGTATVTIPIPAGVDASKFVVYHVHDDGSLVEMSGAASADGTKYTFTTTHFSVFVGGVRNNNASVDDNNVVTGTGNLPGGTTYTYTQATSITADEEYVIVANNNPVALMDDNGSMGSQTVTISGTTMTSDVELTEWTFSGRTSGTIYNETRYLRYNDGEFSLNRTTSSTIYITNNDGNFKLGGESNRTGRALYYTGSQWDTSGRNTARYVRLYQLSNTNTSNDTEVIFKLQKPAVMETESTQNLVYEVTLADDTTVNNCTIQWTSGTNYYVTVSNGVLTATANTEKEETTNITARLTHVNGTALSQAIELSVPVTVKAPVITFDVTPDNVDMLVTKTQQLTPTVTYNGAAATSPTIRWVSSDTSVATVDSNGLVTPVKAGTTTITATLSRANGKTVNLTKTISVTISEKEAVGISVDPTTITVERDTSASAEVGKIIVDYGEGDTQEIPLTLGMLQGNKDLTVNGIYSGLTVSYAGKTAENITLRVIDKSGDNYPEYPNPGSVNVEKTADATHLQNSGVVNVELSTSGLPVETGVDVIVMLDLSSSMDRCIVHDDKNCTVSGCSTRLEALESALATFETELDNSPKKDNIRVAIADFDVFYSSGAVAYDSSDYIESSFSASGSNTIYTGTGTIGAGAFIPVSELNTASFNLSSGSGTNYDYAFDTIYQLGTAIQQQNKANGQENRELVVLFMSDGAANQFNFYRTTGGTSAEDPDYGWNFWLDGTMTADDLKSTANGGRLNSATHAYYYDSVDHDGDGHYNEHRMANAIKGDPNTKYEVIRKSASIAGGVTLEEGSKDNLYLAPGLGATMYAIAFDIAHDGPITDEAIFASLEQVPTSDEYYVNAASEDDLLNAFRQFATDINYAATGAYFVDQLGDSFDLQMTTTVNARNESGELEQTTLSQLTGGALTAPKIQVRNYNIYKASDVNGTTVTADMVGKRYGDPIVMEEVTFTDDGNGNVTGVYSNQINGGSTNILGENGVISAKYFYYNTSSTIQTVNGIRLEPETFRWNIGIINNVEWALSYYTYLTGSMEGNTSSGSYKTNNYATLYYKNWLGNNAFQGTTSPQTGWKSANVSYAFYLVDSLGRPVVNQTTGETGNFINAVKVTQPVVFDEIMLNNLDDIDTIEAKSVAILPSGYDLYDTAASYKVVILSADGKGSWTITSSRDPQTTYVTGHAGSDVSNVKKVTSNNEIEGMTDYQLETGYDYTHTTVWFAVVWVPKTIPDAVVVDYGLPVDISVLANDQFGQNGSLSGVGKTDDKETILENANNPLYTGEHSALFTDKVSATYGDAETFGKKIRYTPKTMSWGDGEVSFDKFAYEVKYEQYNYSDKDNPVHMATQYYYGDVSVIPATTVYYEDSFVDLKSFTVTRDDSGKATSTLDTTSKWVADRTATNITQGEDRPGKYSSADIDKNQVYGYDAAYTTMSEHSLNNAAKITVDANTRGEAYFTFYGTGFDVISMTSNTTGTMTVQVYAGPEASGTAVKTMMVDTYYGYTKDAEGNWVVNNSVENSLYQIPVIKIAGLTYGQYTVKITAGYNNFFNHTATAGAYDLYLDAIRIYDPAGAGDDLVFDEEDPNRDMTIADIYAQDGEGWPRYEELRNQLISEDTYKSASDTSIYKGAIFIDGNGTNLSVADYTSYGPNNELYLAAGQSVAFELDLSSYIRSKTINGKQVNVSIVADTQIGVKSADGSNVKVTLNADNVSSTREFTTTSDMYYSFSQMVDLGTDVTGEDTANDSKTVITISNTGASGVVSITNLKITFKENPNATQQAEVPMLLSMSRSTGERALMMLRAPAVEDEIPEETVPEVTEPEVTEPEVTEPEVTEPEVTEPEATEPEVTEPEATEPEVTEPEESKPQVTPEQVASAITNVVKKVVNALSNLFGRWFR